MTMATRNRHTPEQVVRTAGDRGFGCRLTGVSHVSNRFRLNLKESKGAISHPHHGASPV